MKDKILQLRKTGKSYRAIAVELGIGKTTVEYHCNTAAFMVTQKKRRNTRKKELMELVGGCCFKCGYKRCLSALDFHHKNPSEKDFPISRWRNKEDTLEEIKKCVLLCSNCHHEVHDGLIVL